VQVHLHMRNPGKILLKHFIGFDHQVIAGITFEEKAALAEGNTVCFMISVVTGYFQYIRQWDGVEDRLEIMIAIIALAQDAKPKVDLAVRKNDHRSRIGEGKSG
jgi:hypothetical protein